MQQLEVAKYCLEYGVGLEAETQLDVVEIDSKRELQSSAEQRKILGIFLGSWRKFTYQSLEDKSPVQNLDWKSVAMNSFDFEDDPFRWIQEEMDQLQGQYSKLEAVIRGASKLLGDYRPGNIVKELKMLKQKDMATLEATNVALSS